MTSLPTHNLDHNLDLRPLTAEIVAAYVSKNPVSATALPDVIAGTYAALVSLGAVPPVTEGPAEREVEKATPAQIRKSITPDALISFVDGKPYKTLKRHLALHGLDAHSYRNRYGLPSDYPTTAPNYSERRSALAKARGLGKRGEHPSTLAQAAE